MRPRAIALAWSLVTLCLSLTACSDGPDAADAASGGRDSGPGDAGLVDSGPRRARDGGFDAALVDAGSDAALVDAGLASERHTMRPLGTTGAAQGYWQYLPPGYTSARPAPLLLFLHGIGENGDGASELDRVTTTGIPWLIETDRWPGDRPFLVLSPQHPGSGCHTAAEIRAFLEYAIGEYRVDLSRVYATGLSCGGIGLWNYLGEDADTRVVAAVPIAGDGRAAYAAGGCALGRVAIWAFHGDADTSVPPAGTIEPITDLLRCARPAPREARMTIYPGVGHGSWQRTYDLTAGHDIYAWLLGFTRR